MGDARPQNGSRVDQGPSPNEVSDPPVRDEFRKAGTVDVPPAPTLGNQILAFALPGLALADLVTALARVALERRAEREGERRATRPA